MILVGSHLSFSRGFLAMGKEALSLGENTFAWFTRNPRGGAAKAADPADAEALRALMRENGFGPLVAHAPYTMNLCSAREDVREFSRAMLREDLERTDLVPGGFYNLHPGSRTGQDPGAAVRQVASAIGDVLSPGMRTKILLETMSGKGSEVGGSFEELRDILSLLPDPSRVGVCLDTCHVWDAGYDVGDIDRVLGEFDRVLGLSRLCAVHLNDSMNPRGSRRDRHQKLGQGQIGADALRRVVTHPCLRGLPFILETPNDADGYREEVRTVRAWAGEG